MTCVSRLRSFGRRVADLRAARAEPATPPIADCAPAPMTDDPVELEGQRSIERGTDWRRPGTPRCGDP